VWLRNNLEPAVNRAIGFDVNPVFTKQSQGRPGTILVFLAIYFQLNSKKEFFGVAEELQTLIMAGVVALDDTTVLRMVALPAQPANETYCLLSTTIALVQTISTILAHSAIGNGDCISNRDSGYPFMMRMLTMHSLPDAKRTPSLMAAIN
jgi:hypothetical protein